jgi:CRP/FNR family cyclic AMP-dependent transcriptional regulator
MGRQVARLSDSTFAWGEALTAVSKKFDPKVFLASINGGRSAKSYAKDEVVFAQGDPADAVFYVQKGRVKVTVASKQGREAVIAILPSGSFVGEGCLVGQPVRLATASALVASEVMRLDKAAMVKVLHDQPDFAELFTAYLLMRNSRVEEDLVDQLFNSSEKRLARVLLLLANFGKDGRQEPVVTKISQETLAEMVGTTRSRINFFMNKFRQLGLIEYNGSLQVHTALLNVVLRD